MEISRSKCIFCFFIDDVCLPNDIYITRGNERTAVTKKKLHYFRWIESVIYKKQNSKWHWINWIGIDFIIFVNVFQWWWKVKFFWGSGSKGSAPLGPPAPSDPASLCVPCFSLTNHMLILFWRILSCLFVIYFREIFCVFR